MVKVNRAGMMVAALCGIAPLAHAKVGLDANMELDSTYYNRVSDAKSNARDSDTQMSGRVEANFSSTGLNGDAFVKARASLLIKRDSSAAADDLWVMFGNSRADLKLGRFEAMDLFPLAKDTVVETDIVNGYSAYRANALRGRFGSGRFHAALGVKLATGLRAEIGVVRTNDDGAPRGVRPALEYTRGALTLRAGMEFVKEVGISGSETGYGASLGYQLGDTTRIHLNFAKRRDNRTVGFNAVIGPAGIGVIHGKGDGAANKATTVYAAYSFPLLDVKGASITPAISVAKGGSGTGRQVAARVRINYAF